MFRLEVTFSTGRVELLDVPGDLPGREVLRYLHAVGGPVAHSRLIGRVA